MAELAPQEAPSKLPLVVVGAVAVMAVLIVIAVIASRDPVTYEPGTPEAALQDYVNAALDDDEESMLKLLAPAVRTGCADELDSRFRSNWRTDGLSAELDELTTTGAEATAIVRFKNGSSGGPFDGSGWSYRDEFTLELIDGAWYIARAGWPYPLDSCTHKAG